MPPARGIPAITERHPRTESGEKSEDHERVLDVLRWGLVPHWAKDPRTGYKMINARAETVTKKPAYRSAFANHRCLIVVDGFFEWQVPDPASPKSKVPFYFRRADGQPLTFAGLYETWWDKSRSEEPDPETMLRTCTIITTNAGADMVDVHDRMPVIIERPDFDRWLDPDQHDTEALAKLLLPAPKGTLVRHPVDKAVNSPRNDGPMIIQHAPPDEDDATRSLRRRPYDRRSYASEATHPASSPWHCPRRPSRTTTAWRRSGCGGRSSPPSPTTPTSGSWSTRWRSAPRWPRTPLLPGALLGRAWPPWWWTCGACATVLVEELLTDAWLHKAPRTLADAFEAGSRL